MFIYLQGLFSIKRPQVQSFRNQMLDNRLRKLAIDAMDRLMSHPISSPFRNSLKSEEARLQNPVSLSGIREALLEGKYTRVQSWFEEIELCWTNFDSLRAGEPTKVSLFRGVTGELRRLFAKEKRLFTEPELDDWVSEVSEQQKKVKCVMAGAAASYAAPKESVRVTTSDGLVLDGFGQIQAIAKKLQCFLQIGHRVRGPPRVVCFSGHIVPVADLENHIDHIVWQMTLYRSQGWMRRSRRVNLCQDVADCLQCFFTWVQSLSTDSQSTLNSLRMKRALKLLGAILSDVEDCNNEVDSEAILDAIHSM
jgi:hypothetical protein